MACVRLAMAALVAVAGLHGQGRVESSPYIDQLIHNPGIPVDLKDDIDAPARKGSAQHLANSWNRLVVRFRASESRFSGTETHLLAATLLHIQGGLSLIGLRSVGSDAVPSSRLDLARLLLHTSDLCRQLEIKRQENRGVIEFEKLLKDARALDAEARKMAPVVPAAQLAPGRSR